MTERQTTGATAERRWHPANNIIKGHRTDGWRYTCDNTGCDAPGLYVFEQGDAVWISCAACKPDGVEAIVRLERTTDTRHNEQRKERT